MQCFTPVYNYRDYVAYLELIDNFEIWDVLSPDTRATISFDATRYNVDLRRYAPGELLPAIRHHIKLMDEDIRSEFQIIYHWDYERGLRQQLETNSVTLFMRCLLQLEPGLVRLLCYHYISHITTPTDDVNRFLILYYNHCYHSHALSRQWFYRVASVASCHGDIDMLDKAFRKHYEQRKDEDMKFDHGVVENIVLQALKYDQLVSVDFLLCSKPNSEPETSFEAEMAFIRLHLQERFRTHSQFVKCCVDNGSVKCYRKFFTNMAFDFHINVTAADIMQNKYPCLISFYLNLYNLGIFDLILRAITERRTMVLYGLQGLINPDFFSGHQKATLREALTKAPCDVIELASNIYQTL